MKYSDKLIYLLTLSLITFTFFAFLFRNYNTINFCPIIGNKRSPFLDTAKTPSTYDEVVCILRKNKPEKVPSGNQRVQQLVINFGTNFVHTVLANAQVDAHIFKYLTYSSVQEFVHFFHSLIHSFISNHNSFLVYTCSHLSNHLSLNPTIFYKLSKFPYFTHHATYLVLFLRTAFPMRTSW